MADDDEGLSTAEEAEQAAPPPRRKPVEPRSSWVALAGVFLVNILTSSTDTSFGILYDYFIDKYNTNRSTIGWLLSVYACAAGISSLFCSPVVLQYGCRVTFISGLLCFAVGVSLSAIVPNTVLLTMTYGVIAGFGFGICLLSTQTVIQQCFDRNRGLANGISSLGFTAGGVLSPILINHFLSVFGLSGALIMYGALYVQAIVFAMFIKSPQKFVARGRHRIRRTHEDLEQRHTGTDLELYVQIQGQESTTSKPNNYDESKPKCYELKPNNHDKSPPIEETVRLAQCKTEEKDVNIYRHNSTMSHELPSKNGSTDSDHVQSFPIESNSHWSGQTSTKEIKSSVDDNKCKWTKNVRIFFKSAFNWTYFKNPAFVCVYFCFLLLRICRFGLIGQMVGAVIHRGLTPEEAAKIVPAVGVGSLVTRLLSTVLLNFEWMDPVLFILPGIILLACGAFVAITAHTYAMFVSCFAFMGLAEGIYNTVDALIFVQVVGVPDFPSAYSICRLLMIPGPLLVVPFTGWLFDTTGSYVSAFIFLSVCAVLSAGFALATHFFLSCRQQDRNK